MVGSVLRTWMCLACLLGLANACPAQTESAKQAPAQAEPNSLGQDAKPDSLRTTQSFRPILIPDNRKSEFIRGMVPIRKGEFLERWQQWQARQTPEQITARIKSAVYRATLENETWIDGQAELEVEPLEQDRSAMVEFGQVSMSMGNARWSAEQRNPPVWGATSEGVTWLQAKRKGKFLFDWSFRGQRNAVGEIEFKFQLPPTLYNLIELTTPAGVMLRTQSGILQRQSIDTSAGDSPVTWRIETGGRQDFSVFCIDANQPRQRKLGVSQKADYLLSRGSLEANIELQPYIRGGSLSTLELSADNGLVLISAQLGDQFLPDESIQIDQDGDTNRWRITLPRPLQGQAEPIRLRAFARAALDDDWTLPEVRVDAGEWNATVISLELAPELELRRFVTSQSHHRNVSRSAQGNLRLQFEHLEAAGKVDLVVGERDNQPHIESGLHLQLDPERITARLVADVRADQGELYSVTVAPSADWRILSVATVPPTALLTDEFEWSSDAPFTIPLRTAASKSNPVRIVIQGVREYSDASRKVRFQDARMATFEAHIKEQRLVRVSAGENGQAALSEDVGVLRLASEALSEAELERLGGAEGVLFRDGNRVFNAVASLRPQASSFSVTVQAAYDVESQRTSEVYRLRCTPESMTLNELTIRFSEERKGDLKWSVIGQPNGVLSAVRQAVQGGQGGEQWLVTLRRTYDRPFELVARRDSASASELVQASFIDVVGAASQLSNILVQSSDKTPLKLTPEGLEPASAPPAASGQYNLVQAAYHHETPRRAALRIERLTDAQPACWVWRMATHARLEASGLVGYRSVLQIENAGRSEIYLTVPKNTVDWLVYVNDLEAAAFKAGNKITVPLPHLRSRPTVVLRYRTRGEAVHWMGSVKLSPPEPDMPVLRRDWTVLLPPGFSQWPDASEADWRSRLLDGSLASLLRSLQVEGKQWEGLWLSEEQIHFASLAETLREKPENWSQLADSWSQRLSDKGRQLRVDTASLQEAGVGIDDSLSLSSPPLTADKIESWLAQHKLAIARERSELVLRSLNASQLKTPVSGELISLRQWSRSDRSPTAAWDVGIANPNPAIRPHRVQLQFIDANEVQAHFYNRNTFAAWEWSMMCIALALTLRLAPKSTTWILSAAMLLVALTLWAPISLVFLARGTAYGVMLACLARRLIRRQTNTIVLDDDAQPTDSQETRTLQGAATITGVVSWILIVAYAFQSHAQDAPPRGQFGLPDDQPNVLIPADEKLQPLGDFYYVSPALYRQLMQTRPDASSAQPWLTRDATYTLRAEQDTLSDVNARMTIDVRTPGNLVAPFPIERIRSAYWDGRPITIPPQAKALEVYARTSGLHELEVVLKASLAPGAEPYYSIPAAPCANATVILEGADKLSNVRFPNARGDVRQTAPDRWRAELGDRTSVQVSWQSLGQPADVREIEAEEMYWMRVRPNSVSVEAQLQLRPLRSDVRQFSLLADPALQLLNIGREQGVEKHEPIVASDDWVLHRFTLTEAIEDERTIRLSFLWKGMRGVGRMPAPRLKVDARYVRDRRLAISVAQPLTWDLKRDDLWESLAPADFASAWGDEGAPLTAFRAPRDEAAWTLQTRYPRPNSEADANMVVVVEDKQLLCELEIEFEDSSTDRFQHRFVTPPGFQLVSASLIEATRERAIQARHEESPAPEPGQLTLLSERSLTGAHRIKIVGRLARPQDAFPLPFLGMQNGKLQVQQVRVYRWPDATPLRWVKIRGFDRQKPAESDAYSARYGRLAAILNRNQDPAEVRLRTSSKRASAAKGVIVTALTREQGAWLATSRFRLTVSNKSPLDVLRFEVPSEWTDLNLSPDWAFRLAPLPNADRQQLIVYPPTPVTSANVTIHGKLSIEGDDRLRQAPEITPLDLRSLKRYLVLPRRLENQRYVWEVSGREEDPPSDLKPALPSEGEYQSILALGNSRASVQVVRQLAGELSIESADYRLRWRNRQEAYGVAQFDVDPAGTQSCLLSAPNNVQLIGIYVDGIERHLRKPASRSLSISFGADQLPQRITVVFLIKRANAAGTQAGPFLATENNDPLPCRRTWWTIDSSLVKGSTWITTRTAVTRDQTAHNLARLRTATSVLQIASKRDTGASQDELSAWFSTWSARIARLEAQLNEVALNSDEETAIEIREALAANAVSQDLAVSRLSARPAAMTTISDPATAWERTSNGQANTHIEYADLQQPSIPFSPGPPESSKSAPPWLFAIGLALAAGLVVASRSRSGLREWFSAWPQSILAAAGLAWWAWMPAPWLGLAIAALMLASSFDSSWRQTRR